MWSMSKPSLNPQVSSLWLIVYEMGHTLCYKKNFDQDICMYVNSGGSRISRSVPTSEVDVLTYYCANYLLKTA